MTDGLRIEQIKQQLMPEPTPATDKKDTAPSSSASTSGTSTTPQLQLSAPAQDVQTGQQALKQSANVVNNQRAELIQELQQQVATGNYPPAEYNQLLTDKFLQQLFG